MKRLIKKSNIDVDYIKAAELLDEYARLKISFSIEDIEYYMYVFPDCVYNGVAFRAIDLKYKTDDYGELEQEIESMGLEKFKNILENQIYENDVPVSFGKSIQGVENFNGAHNAYNLNEICVMLQANVSGLDLSLFASKLQQHSNKTKFENFQEILVNPGYSFEVIGYYDDSGSFNDL